MERVPRSPIREYSIVDRRLVFTLFRHENDRSFSAVVTGIIQAIWYAVCSWLLYARYGSINLNTSRRLLQLGDSFSYCTANISYSQVAHLVAYSDQWRASVRQHLGGSETVETKLTLEVAHPSRYLCTHRTTVRSTWSPSVCPVYPS